MGKSQNSAGLGGWLRAMVHSAPRSGWLVGILAVIIAFAIGAVFILIAGASVSAAYDAMFKGAIFNYDVVNTRGFMVAIRPFTDSLFFATPLIMAGLGLAFGFRAGLFNIGGAGQIMFGSLAAIWVAFKLDLPFGLHTLVALVAAAMAGGLYAGIAGFLKARTGANEVIVTIMLNQIAILAVAYTLSLPSWHRPGDNNPLTPIAKDTAGFPKILGEGFALHFGFILAIIAVVVFWWVLERSTFGFEVRAVGENPHAACTAGMNIGKVTTLTMLVSGIFAGLAGANEALGTMYQQNSGVASGIAGTIGFDAITVALLGRNKPWGVFFAGLLFGAFKAGGYKMQAQGVPIDMILILESVIVLLIAAPALVRWLFRLPKPDGKGLRELLAEMGGAAGATTAYANAGATASATTSAAAQEVDQPSDKETSDAVGSAASKREEA